MPKRVRDFIQIADLNSLDRLIERLVEIRDVLSDDAEAELKLCGDDVFGRYFGISFMRPQTAEEAECEARYADAACEPRDSALDRLEQELGFCPLARRGKAAE